MNNFDTEEFKRKSIANQIRNLRKDMGMTQQQFGEDMGTSKQCINSMERGRNYPSFKFIENLYFVYGLSVSEMLENTYAEISHEQSLMAIERSENPTKEEK